MKKLVLGQNVNLKKSLKYYQLFLGDDTSFSGHNVVALVALSY